MADIEEHIRKAIEDGKFNDLPGKGKPLKLEDDTFEDPDWRLAYHVLREGGYSLPWIEQRREIETEIEATRTALLQAWEWRQEALAEKKWAYAMVEEDWRRALKVFEQKVAKINQMIFDYNLQTPTDSMQIMKLNPQTELKRLSEYSH